MINIPKRPEPTLQLGERVKHDKFGEGTVCKLSHSSNGKHVYVDVEFDSASQSNPNATSTRYRKIMESFLLSLGVPEALEVEVASNNLLDGTDMVLLDFSQEEDEYKPSQEEEGEFSDEDEKGELNFS